MSPAVVESGSSITSPQQMQSKQPPPSLQNHNPNNLSEQCQGSSHADSKAVNSLNLGSAIDGGINCTFASRLVSRVSSEKSNHLVFSGRSRPRLVKLRKQLGSQYGRSTSESAQNDPCFIPFRSLWETSDRVKDGNITSNGFGASTGDLKFGKLDSACFVFGANQSNTSSSSTSERRESGESAGQWSANEFGKFHNVSFVFGANRSPMKENRQYNKSTGQTGAKVGFEFDANKSNLVPNSKSEERESSGNAGPGVADEFGKLDNLGFVFGSNKCDSVSNSKSEQRESNERAGRSGGNDFGKYENAGFVFGANKSSSILNSDLEKREYKSSYILNSDLEKTEYRESMGKKGADEFPKFDNVGFVFGANENNLVMNPELETKESSESVRKSGANEFGKFDNVDFVVGANRSNLNSEEREFVFGSIPVSSALKLNLETRKPGESVRKFVDERGKMKEENKEEFMEPDNASFAFGANHGDLVSNSNAEMKESSENVGKLASDVRGKNWKMKLDAGADSGNLDNVGFVFEQNWSDLTSNSNLGKRESSENVGKSVSIESGGMKSGAPFGKFDNVGFVFGANQSVRASVFQKATPKGVSRSRGKKSSSFRENTKLTDEMDKVVLVQLLLLLPAQYITSQMR
ncbi:hypothetical protein F0562_017457 [Nyssa sinensis]|uniref:Uncharacterized protein n=1 Tax=Nyssa sinensis TaxID=561372 RepID=A0A5J4ZH39_9ASTE|nr:hypothetical protein F0562_017457 [Nyssa sinensis]